MTARKKAMVAGLLAIAMSLAVAWYAVQAVVAQQTHSPTPTPQAVRTLECPPGSLVFDSIYEVLDDTGRENKYPGPTSAREALGKFLANADTGLSAREFRSVAVTDEAAQFVLERGGKHRASVFVQKLDHGEWYVIRHVGCSSTTEPKKGGNS